MSKCVSCRLEVQDYLTYCPLCGKFINAEPKDMPIAYPKVNKRYIRKNAVLTLLRSILIATVLICVGINFFVLLYNGQPISNLRDFWSFYIIASALLINYAILTPIGHGTFLWTEMYIILFSCILYLLFIDFFTTQTPEWGWSVTWAIPILISCISLMIFIFNLSNKTDPAGSTSALFVMLILSAVMFGTSIIFYNLPQYFGIPAIVPSFIALCETVFFSIILGMIRRTALKKKFHF